MFVSRVGVSPSLAGAAPTNTLDDPRPPGGGTAATQGEKS
ncbi:unnamed protein product [Acidocella sp. C78]|nr:unnamed protein product [Acidocella sp. C78]